MTILDQMLPPAKPRNEELERLIEVTGQRVTMADIADLARMAAHENDEEVVVPVPGSAGEAFLREAARSFVRWISQEGRFPSDDEVDEVAGGPTTWHRETASGSQVSQAYTDLGLYYSAHVGVAGGADVAELRKVLDAAAGELIFTLTTEYAPYV